MAIKKRLDPLSSYEDLYDTQNALDKGILNSLDIPGTEVKTATIEIKDPLTGISLGKKSKSTNPSPTVLEANKDNMGSILGMSDVLNANRKKRAEQDKASGQGFGLQSSILGGGSF